MSQPITSAGHYGDVTWDLPGLAVVKCGAKWCKPCNDCSPQYESLARKYSSFARFYTLDVDAVPDFGDAGMVKSLPTFLLMKNGKPIGMTVGANMEILEQHIRQNY